jgi:putative transposase
LFLIRHSRREIIHFNVTESPTSEWVVQQLREVSSDGSEDRDLIFDRDAKFGADVQGFLDSAGISAMRTSYRSPCRTELPNGGFEVFGTNLLDHVIVVHEGHVNRLARDYLRYYHADRTHDGLNKDTPQGRPKSIRNPSDRLESLPRLGGLHHRYSWAKAA